MPLSMLKNISAILMFVLMLGGCSTSRDARKAKKSVNGSWILKTISTEAVNGKFTAKIFNEADYNCFIGSAWDLTSNNSSGFYILDGMSKNCPAQKRFIRWSIYEQKDSVSQVQFKRLDEKKNEMDDGNGFRLDIVSIDKTTMQLKSNISFEGHAAAIIYNFIKK